MVVKVGVGTLLANASNLSDELKIPNHRRVWTGSQWKTGDVKPN